MVAQQKGMDAGVFVVTLPALKVRIVRDGATVKTVEIPDPREAFCRAFNAASPGDYQAIAEAN